jgi:hypothetical protein
MSDLPSDDEAKYRMVLTPAETITKIGLALEGIAQTMHIINEALTFRVKNHKTADDITALVNKATSGRDEYWQRWIGEYHHTVSQQTADIARLQTQLVHWQDHAACHTIMAERENELHAEKDAEIATLQAALAQARAALEAIAMRTDGPSFHLDGDIRGIINEALSATDAHPDGLKPDGSPCDWYRSGR